MMSDLSEVVSVAARALETAERNQKPDVAALIVEAIEYDINDRRGLKNEWREIDDHVTDEIKEVWKSIVRQAMAKHIFAR